MTEESRREEVTRTVYAVGSDEFDATDDEEQVELEIERTSLELHERSELISMRTRWSWVVMALLVAIVVADIFFMWAVGFGWLSFEREWEVPVFVGESIIKTIGLAYIIVQFLFNKESVRG